LSERRGGVDFTNVWVKSMKLALKKAIGKTLLKYEELVTLITEIEGILNSRPLTYISDSSPNPLTPAHFLIGYRSSALPVSLPQSAPLTLGMRFKRKNEIINKYWTRWRSEYLTSLRKHFEQRKRTNPSLNIKVGDVVLVRDDGKKRCTWKMGRVQEVMHGRDGCIRSAVVRTENGVLRRAVECLYPLEC